MVFGSAGLYTDAGLRKVYSVIAGIKKKKEKKEKKKKEYAPSFLLQDILTVM